MNIYIACALTHVPESCFEDYSNLIVNIADQLSSHGHEVKYALANSDPQLAKQDDNCKAKLCYQWDKDMVLWSDLVIAEASFPSTGMGIELQLADNNKIPIVICFKEDLDNKADPKTYRGVDHIDHNLQIGDGYISLMALGLPSLKNIVKYSSRLDLFNQIVNLEEANPNLTSQNTRTQQVCAGV